MTKNIIYTIGNQIHNKYIDLINSKSQKEKECVYVVGNGWASYYFVKYIDKTKFIPIIIAPNSKVLNTPKLVNRVFNSNELVEFANPYATIILDLVEDINISNKTLITESGHDIYYNNDRVVLAIGSEPNDFNIPGVSEYTMKFKTIADADLLREKLDILKKDEDSKIYIIGGGVSGIELATKISKLECERKYKNLNIKVIDGMDTILQGFNTNTKKNIYELMTLKYPNVEIKLNCIVNLIKSNCLDNPVQLEYFDKILNQTFSYWLNYKHTTDIIIWTGGVRFCGYGKTKLYSSLNQISQIKPRGIDVESNFSLKNQQNSIYCLGDMVGNMGPPSAQNAKNQGIWLAKYFNSGFDNDYLKSNPYEIKSNGKEIHLANHTYFESKYFCGFIPKFFHKIIDYFN